MRTKNRAPLCALTQGAHVRARSHGHMGRDFGNQIKGPELLKFNHIRPESVTVHSSGGSRNRAPGGARITYSQSNQFVNENFEIICVNLLFN